MALFDFARRNRPASPAPVPVTGTLVAAASPAVAPLAQYMRHTDQWQNRAWGFHDTVGEFNYGVRWKASMMSRVRLRAARIEPGSDEPVLADSGPAVEIMSKLGGGPGGQSQIMRRLSVQLSVPGEGYLIGEEVFGTERWQVRSIDETRASNNKWQVTDENDVNLGMVWRDLAPESVPVRIWKPHDRWYHLADSPSRSALDTLRELELVNRAITAEYLSRLASAGLLLLPEEVSFPAKEEYADSADPFVEEWISIAAEGIKNPGTASAVVPIILRVPAEYLDKVKHIDFTLKIDDKIIEKRDSVIKRLASELDLPSDVLLGLGDMNHWNAWASETEGLQAHISPDAETICDSLTRGYLGPRMVASDEDPAGWVVWYDLSELTIKPDRSQGATNAYDRFELSGEALRRETGFSEEDKPDDAELKDMLLKGLVRTAHGAAPGAVDVLVGTQLVTPATIGPGASQQNQGIPSEPGMEPDPNQEAPPAPAGKAVPPAKPGAQDTPKTAPDAADAGATASAVTAAALRHRQATTQHVVVFRTGHPWDLRHPPVCNDAEFTCPFLYAASTNAPLAAPGTAGSYLCHLDPFGQLRFDGAAMYLDTSLMASTPVKPVRRVNGMAHA
jgi:hypothetical protein